eukprot:NODE_46_length_32145_cov_0.918711.p11 type:complete len:380 gc:universal NODE_46_length_32145_cov_0.918711:24322-25461(+)
MSMQKPTFRSRKIDKHRQMCVLLEEDVDFDGTIRDTQNIDYGVDKEEAEEEHLLQSLQTQFQTKKAYVPLPDVQLLKRPKKLFQRPIDWIRHNEPEIVEYCSSKEEIEFVKNHPGMKLDEYEYVMQVCDSMMLDRLPHASIFDIGDLLYKIVTGYQKPHLEEIIPVIYDHYKTKFLEKNNILMPVLLPAEKFESDSHPYKSFRPREIATFRKTRQSQNSTSRLKQWNSELSSAHQLLQMVAHRERIQKEVLLVDQIIFEKKLKVKLKRKQLGLPDEEQKPLARQKLTSIGDGIKRRIQMDKDYVDISLSLFNHRSWAYRLRQGISNMIIDRNSSFDAYDVLSDEEIEIIDPNEDSFTKIRYEQLTQLDWNMINNIKKEK